MILQMLGFKDKDDDDYSPAYPPGYPMQNNSMRRLDSRSKLPILELKVPMCCDKCQEKVKEELESLEGVRSVECDQFNQRVTITGNVDPVRALKRVKKVKKKSEFFVQECHIDRAYDPMAPNKYNNSNNFGYGTQQEAGDLEYTQNRLIRSSSFGRGSTPYNNNSYNTHYVQQPGSGRPLGLMRSNSHDRNLNRLPSFGKVVRHDGARHLDFEPQDLQRDFYATRRMPSFKNHRHHDAEYIAMGNEHIPAISDTYYANSGPPVVRNNGGGQRPAPGMFRSQVSFKKLPVSNPYYLRQISSDTHWVDAGLSVAVLDSYYAQVYAWGLIIHDPDFSERYDSEAGIMGGKAGRPAMSDRYIYTHTHTYTRDTNSPDRDCTKFRTRLLVSKFIWKN